MVQLYRQRFEHYGHGPAEQAIVGLGAQAFIRPRSQDARAEYGSYFAGTPRFGGLSVDEYSAQTPLAVGSPQEVIDKILAYRDYVGDIHRILFTIDAFGTPAGIAQEQLHILGTDIVPVLRREMAPAAPPALPLTHTERVTAEASG